MNDPVVIEPTERTIAFSAILEGALGERERDAAQTWLQYGAPTYNLDQATKKHKLVSKESTPRCYDTRTFDIPPPDIDTDEARKLDNKKPSQHTKSINGANNNNANASSSTPNKTNKSKPNKESSSKRPSKHKTNEYSRDAFIPYDMPASIKQFRRMPAGWSSEAGIPPIPGAYLSPEGILCTSEPMIAAVMAVQGQSAGTSLQQLISWLKNLSTTRLGDFPDMLWSENMSKIVALQRARIVLYPEERKAYDKKKVRVRGGGHNNNKSSGGSNTKASKRKRVTFDEKK